MSDEPIPGNPYWRVPLTVIVKAWRWVKAKIDSTFTHGV